jgi:hypothetical protein
MSQDSPGDVDLLLVGPGGQGVLLMSDAAGGAAAVRDARRAAARAPIWCYRRRRAASPCSRVAYSSILTAVPRRSVHT